jgi:NAD(P)-dependent dehydrogenase (short-subunit alcohol dehydrogenase family)
MGTKNYLIIGGSSGIGKELATQLAVNNHVIVLSRHCRELSGISIQFHPVDSTDDNPAFPVLDMPLDGLVYAPGNIRLKPFRSLKPDEFMEDWKLNFLGAVKSIQKYLPNLQQADQSSIVLFSTVAVQIGMPYHASIASAKGALEGLTRSLAAEFAPRIRVNAIAPSLTETPLASGLLNNETKVKASIDRHPLKRIGKASEVAALAHFLLSEQAGFITGQVMGIDGGMNLRTL